MEDIFELIREQEEEKQEQRQKEIDACPTEEAKERMRDRHTTLDAADKIANAIRRLRS